MTPRRYHCDTARTVTWFELTRVSHEQGKRPLRGSLFAGVASPAWPGPFGRLVAAARGHVDGQPDKVRNQRSGQDGAVTAEVACQREEPREGAQPVAVGRAARNLPVGRAAARS